MMISDPAFETVCSAAAAVRLRGLADCVEIALASPATASGPPAAPLVVAPHHIIAARAKLGRINKNEHMTATVLMLGFETREGNACLVAG
jgi:hypothetical protein